MFRVGGQWIIQDHLNICSSSDGVVTDAMSQNNAFGGNLAKGSLGNEE